MTTIASRLIDAWNSHDFSRVAEMYAEDCEGVDVGQPDKHRGIDGLHQIFDTYWAAFPDLRFELVASVEEPDAIAMFWRATGTHRGSILRIPATGRTVEILGSTHHSLVEGKMIRSLYIWDTAGLLRSLGLLPDLSI